MMLAVGLEACAQDAPSEVHSAIARAEAQLDAALHRPHPAAAARHRERSIEKAAEASERRPLHAAAVSGTAPHGPDRL